jgi:hypothetical protein
MLRAELSELYNEKKKLYPEYYELKDEFKNISTIKENTDSILGRTHHHDYERDFREKNHNKNKSVLE